MPRKRHKSLAFVNPRLAKEWDYEKNYPLTPEDVFAHSIKEVGWECQKDKSHKWTATINARSYGTECPYCSGHKICKENCLSTLRPDLAKEWDYEKNYPLTPEDVFRYSKKAVGWICKKCGGKWTVSPNRRSHNDNCPYCAGRGVWDGNCLATLNPKLAKEWDYEKNYPLTPKDIRGGSNKKVGWVCKKCGHRWLATIYSRSNGGGCPCCSGRKVCKINCLATVNPKLAKEWDYERNHPLTPFDVTRYCNKKVGWICKEGHHYDATIINRSHGSNCPYCAGQKATKENCLATLRPDLAKEWHSTKNGKLTPYDVMPYTNKKVAWECKKGHIYMARVSARSKGDGCSHCCKQKVHKENCLAVINPGLASEWHPTKNGKLTPYDVCPNTNKKSYWECPKCGREWSASPNSRTRGTNCPDCYGGHSHCYKIKLKNGVVCDSRPEAYYWLELDSRGIKFEHHVVIGIGRCICDFYIPSTNTYIEVTSYKTGSIAWKKYYKNLLRKKRYITKTLKANFEFVKMVLTPKQVQYVRENMA